MEKASLQDDVQAVGSLRSYQSVMLRPEVAGRVKALGFADGAPVKAGQVLVQLDDSVQQAELQQALAQVSIAQANHQRNLELVAQNFVARRVLDESAANLQVVQAQMALAQARLARMTIRAPFAGTVGNRNVNLGDFVKDGADLVNLEDTSRLLVDFRLPERYLGKLRPRQTVELSLDAMPGRVFEAQLESIDPLVDANGRAVTVRAALSGNKGAPGPLRPGMFARVNTVFSVNPEALVLPEEAIVPQGGRQFVIKAVAASAPTEETLFSLRQEVKLGVRRSGKVEIVDGVTEGQQIVLAGQQRLQRDGTPLKVVNASKAAQAAAVPASAASASASASTAASR